MRSGGSSRSQTQGSFSERTPSPPPQLHTDAVDDTPDDHPPLSLDPSLDESIIHPPRTRGSRPRAGEADLGPEARLLVYVDPKTNEYVNTI